MSKVTHLSRNFRRRFAGITELLHQELPTDEYLPFRGCIKQGNLVEANNYLESLYQEKNEAITISELAEVFDKAKSAHEFRDMLKGPVVRWKSFEPAVCAWFKLMKSVGGAENAEKLAKKQHLHLSAPMPWKISHAS